MTEPLTLSQRLALIIGALQKIVAAHGGRHREAAPMVVLVWSYLARLAARFDSLVRRVRAGELATRPTGTHPTRTEPSSGKLRLPTGYAWLIRLAQETAQLAGQVQQLLADPEFSALLATAPQAGRILRPLCHMLGIRPSPDVPGALFPPPVPRARRQQTPMRRTATESPTPPKPSPENRPPHRRTLFNPA